MHPTIQIESFVCPPLDTNAYLLFAPEKSEAVLIDAPKGIAAAVAPKLESEGLKLSCVYLTHAHFDHILGARELQNQGVRIISHAESKPLIARVNEQLARYGLPAESAAFELSDTIACEQNFSLLGCPAIVHHTPGHSPDGVTLHLPSQGIAFVGDLIFRESVGRTDLPASDFNTLKTSIEKHIYTMDDATKLYAGHGASTTVAHEKANNPFVQG